MKQIFVEIDDRCARELERLAPTKQRMRAEFIRLAIRRAIDLALDRTKEDAYRAQALPGGVQAGDLEGWDEENLLAEHARRPGKGRSRRSGPRSAA